MPLPQVSSKVIAALVVVACIIVVGTVAAGTVLSAESAGLVNIDATEGTNLVGVPAGRQIVLVKRHGKAERLCVGRGPDLAMDVTEGVSLAGSGKSIGENDSVTANDLGGRTEKVLLAREILYRACEIGLNHNTSLEETRKLYQDALQAIVALDQLDEPAPAPAPAADTSGESRKH